MSEHTTLSDTELDEIESALRDGSLRQAEQLDRWISRLLAEVKAVRGGSSPRKHHGDALLDHSGSRHGADARQAAESHQR